MNSTAKRRLSAPCGLDCFNCEIYEENITEEMKKQFALKIQKDPEEVACKGCRPENGCKHLGQPCETLKCIEDKGLEFCFECEEFPCVKLQPVKQGADIYPHNFKLFNLCRMKNSGTCGTGGTCHVLVHVLAVLAYLGSDHGKLLKLRE
ncbi:MAG: DUF3795 domain-containing protein [bacterium]